MRWWIAGCLVVISAATLGGCSSVSENAQGDSGFSTPVAASPADTDSAAAENKLAEEEAQKAKLAKRMQAKVYADTARKFRTMGDFDKAVENYSRALNTDPEFYEAKLETVETLCQQERKDEALKRLRNLLEELLAAPPDRTVVRIRSKAEDLLRRLDTVAIALSEASDVLVRNAVIAEDAGRKDDALNLRRRALELWPANREAREWLTQRKAESEQDGNVLKANKSAGSEVAIVLEEMRPVSSSCNKKDILRVNETRWGGLPIYNGGKVYVRGIWAPAPSKLTYDLAGRYKRFTATVLVSAFKGEKEQIEAIERELQRKDCGTVRFAVYGDGRMLYDSGVLSYVAGEKPVDVKLDGVKELVLEASDAGDGDSLDYAVWAYGQLEM
jgi:tetratricopeptide (TPR) repeat protein